MYASSPGAATVKWITFYNCSTSSVGYYEPRPDPDEIRLNRCLLGAPGDDRVGDHNPNELQLMDECPGCNRFAGDLVKKPQGHDENDYRQLWP